MSLENSITTTIQRPKEGGEHEESVMDALRKAQQSGDQNQIHEAMLKADEKYRVYSRISNITDFVPVIGSAKMVHEAIKGRQTGTQKEIKGWQRVIHGVAGTSFLAADLTGVGAVGSVVGKVLTRGAVKGVEKLALQTAEKKLLQQEGGKLVALGDTRIEKAQKIAANDDGFSLKMHG